MKEISHYRHQKILVLGLAKSGESAATLLHELGAFVTVNDKKPFSENVAAQGLLEQGITVICGDHPVELLDEGFELIVKNPGIPYDNPMVKRAEELQIPIITEVELAYEISEAPFIAITGTNGKTTTTTLIYEMLAADDKNPLIAGNIGTVASTVAKEATKDNVIVIELSSFQLMGIKNFKPEVAVLTNLFDAHLDYHGTREQYDSAKARVVENQTENDFFIFNNDQRATKKISELTKANLIPFSTKGAIDTTGAYIKNNTLYFRDEKIMKINEIVLPGEHNLENILCAVTATKLFGVSNRAIKQVLTTFAGVKHRLQYVGEKEGRKFYNDSKATNILATIYALQSFNEPTILLAGGLDRGNDFDELIPHLKNVKTLITFGETAAKLAKTGREARIKNIVNADNVKDAVKKAYDCSEEGDIILLSPACASWDQYPTFEVRGDIFISAMHKL